MKNKFGRLNGLTYLLMGVVCVLIGVILIINPTLTLISFCSVVGAALAVIGVILLILYFARQGYKDDESADFVVTMCMILGGILVMVRKENISEIFPQFLAVFVMLSGVIKMQNAMDLVGIGDSSWAIHFVMGLIIVILSGLVLIFPRAEWFVGDDRVPMYVCVVMIADGALSIFSILHVTLRKNSYKKKHRKQEIVEVSEEENEDRR